LPYICIAKQNQNQNTKEQTVKGRLVKWTSKISAFSTKLYKLKLLQSSDMILN